MKRAIGTPALLMLAMLTFAAEPLPAAIPTYTTTQITKEAWQALHDAVRATQDVQCREVDPATLYCGSGTLQTDWFFTRSDHPAHPAVIIRVTKLGPNGYEISSTAHFAGARSSFDRWYRDYEVWSRRADDALARQVEEARKYTPQDWERAAVEKIMYDLWAARELGQIARTYEHLAPKLKLDISREDWTRRGMAFRELSGPVKWRKLTGVRWFRELIGTEDPGTYAEVSVSAAFEKIPAYESKLLFHQQGDGSFRLAMEEEKYGDQVASIGRRPPVRTAAAVSSSARTAPSKPTPSKPEPARAQQASAANAGAERSQAAAGGAAIPTDKGGKITEARFRQYVAAVSAMPGVTCERDSFKQLVCSTADGSTEWYFTVAGHTAHPAAVQRKMVGGRRERVGHYAGSKEEFDWWFGTFEDVE